MAGPVESATTAITTLSLRGVLQYEPRDLTISVAAGLPWSELTRLLTANRQMIPLDPPFAATATVGGVIASNCSGPRRRLYGTARDVVIGMQFATLEGKLVQTGGMVVKNVAGLDLAKLMIGSFGTLAAITAVNFKLAPMPEGERSFLLTFDSLDTANRARSEMLKSQLQPSAIDLLNPAAGNVLGNRNWLMALRVGGNPAAVRRYESEYKRLGEIQVLEEEGQQRSLWEQIEGFTPEFLRRHDDGAVVRASCTLKEVGVVMATFPGAAIARAGTGVCYGYFEQSAAAAEWISKALKRGWKAVIEFAPENRKGNLDLWPSPGGDFEIMKRVKGFFDPRNLLNRGRLYRHI